MPLAGGIAQMSFDWDVVVLATALFIHENAELVNAYIGIYVQCWGNLREEIAHNL
jgi:hypothetical protein